MSRDKILDPELRSWIFYGACVVFVLIVSGVQRVQDNDFGGSGPGRSKKVVQALRAAEEMTGRTSVDEQVRVSG